MDNTNQNWDTNTRLNTWHSDQNQYITVIGGSLAHVTPSDVTSQNPHTIYTITLKTMLGLYLILSSEKLPDVGSMLAGGFQKPTSAGRQ